MSEANQVASTARMLLPLRRRLASSTYSLRRSLEKRARRLEDGLKRAQELIATVPPVLPDPEELEEMEESERERLEAMLEAVTLAGSADQVRQVGGKARQTLRRDAELTGQASEQRLIVRASPPFCHHTLPDHGSQQTLRHPPSAEPTHP